MTLIQWEDTFSVNIAEIDLQHKKLIKMINELNEAMRVGKGNDILGKIINDLIDYAVIHFGTEENYFDQFGYPGSDRHKKEHFEFTQKVAEFQSKFSAGKLCLSVEVMRFLSGWLRNHIKGSDKDYGPFLNEKGLK